MAVDGDYWLIEHDVTYPTTGRRLFRKDRMTKNTAVLYLKEDAATTAMKLTPFARNARLVHVRIEEIHDEQA